MDPIPLLRKLIAINSINAFETVRFEDRRVGIGTEQKIAEVLAEELVRIGFTVRWQLVQEECTVERPSGKGEAERVHVPRRWNVLAEKGQGDRSLLFFGHMDTVRISEGWSTPALTATLDETSQRLYGLGANDMKGGLAAILTALEGVQSRPGVKLKVAFLADEECWSFGAVKLLEDREFMGDVRAALVPEIGDFEGSATLGDKAAIILGRMGRCEFEVQVQGVSCHGAQSRENKLAVNAVHQAARLIDGVRAYAEANPGRFTSHDLSISNAIHVSCIEGGARELSVPEKASFWIDRSFTPGENMAGEADRLTNHLKAWQADPRNGIDPRTRWTLAQAARPTPACQPYFTEPHHPFVRFITPHVDAAFGGHVQGIAWSVADENRLSEAGIPVIVLGPKGENCHAKDEWVDVRSMHALCKAYRAIASNWTGE